MKMPRCYLVKKNATKHLQEIGEPERKTPGPKSPTEATTAPPSPGYYRILDRTIAMVNGCVADYLPHMPQDNTVIRRTPVVASHDGGIPIFRERSAEETEAAHDLLELSRSLPPLQNPAVVRVDPRYEDLLERRYSRGSDEGEEASREEYCDEFGRDDVPEAFRPHVPVSVVVRVPSCVQTKRFSPYPEKSPPSILPLESSPSYEDVVGTSVICDATKSETSRRTPEKSLEELRTKSYPRGLFAYGEKPLPSLLPLASYREEFSATVICDGQQEKRLPDDRASAAYEEAAILGYDHNLSSAALEKNYELAYEEESHPMVIAMSSPGAEDGRPISRPVPTKVISVQPDPSVPPRVVRFPSYGPEEREPREREEAAVVEPETNVASHTPVIRFQPSSESSAPPDGDASRESAPFKPATSEYHSDAENNNPNPNEKSVLVRRKRLRASFLPVDWKRKKTNPSEDTEFSGKKKYTCTQCGKKYATSSNLSRHKQTHRSLDSQSAKRCKTCGKAYVSMPALAMHLLTHKLSHACGVCGKMFSRPWLLQGHLRSHTGEKPYRCGHCGKAFADRSNLRAHMQTHSFEKNYICLKCKKSFALKSYLSKHLESSCLKENNDIEMKSGMDSPTDSMDPIDVETWSKDGDVDDPVPIEIETDESMDEIVVV